MRNSAISTVITKVTSISAAYCERNATNEDTKLERTWLILLKGKFKTASLSDISQNVYILTFRGMIVYEEPGSIVRMSATETAKPKANTKVPVSMEVK